MPPFQVLVKISPGIIGRSHPKTGDEVRFWVNIPELDELVDGGTGTVSHTEQETVSVQVERGESLLGAKTEIQATGVFSAASTGGQSLSTSMAPPAQPSREIGLTESRRLALIQLFPPSVSRSQASLNEGCLTEQLCMSDNPASQILGCSTYVRICAGLVRGKVSYQDEETQRQYSTDICPNLWSSLTATDWNMISFRKPCDMPLPPALQSPVFTYQEASCIAPLYCNPNGDFPYGKTAYESCHESLMSCASDPSQVGPHTRLSCSNHLARLNLDPGRQSQVARQIFNQCLR
jgi:hypothetical protein